MLCGGGVLEFLFLDIDDVVVIVVQMGFEFWVQVMWNYFDFDIIIVG